MSSAHQRSDGRPSVWAVTMVKNEEDVLPFTLAHLEYEGIDGIAISDNLSTDGTAGVIKEFHDRCMPAGDPADWLTNGKPFVAMFEDTEVGYYQAQKMTGLATLVHEMYGADWIVPFDADELWTAGHQSVGDYLRSLAPSIDCVTAALYNHFPTSGDPISDNPFLRIVNRDSKPAPLPKVAIRWRDGMTIGMGNHSAGGVTSTVTHGLTVHHFPWRSPEQYVSKIRNGAAAYAATDLPESYGEHWRNHGAILDSGGPEAVEEIYHTWFHDPEEVDLVADPPPFQRWKP